jgi:hypothetical protein
MPVLFSRTYRAPPTFQGDSGKTIDIKQAASKYVHVPTAHPLE